MTSVGSLPTVPCDASGGGSVPFGDVRSVLSSSEPDIPRRYSGPETGLRRQNRFVPFTEIRMPSGSSGADILIDQSTSNSAHR